MTGERKAVVLSMMLHGMFLFGMYTVGSRFAQPGRPVVIDFTLLDSGGAAPARKEAAAGAVPESRRAARYTRKHYAYIKELIEKNHSYPPRARKMGWMGRTDNVRSLCERRKK